MSRPRIVPPDDELKRIFSLHEGRSARWIRDHYGWPVGLSIVKTYRRRLMKPNPIEGAASMPDWEFSLTMSSTQAERFAGRLP
jgi:hypothetical protein